MATRWLDEDEQRVWRTFLECMNLLRDRLDRELQCESGLSHAYYEILVHLSESPTRSLRMSEVATRTLSSRSRVSHAVARLEQEGWVQRVEYEGDGRGAVARLTDEGFAKLEAAAHVHVEGVRNHLFDQLTPAQVRQLGEISGALHEHLVATTAPERRPSCS